MGFKTRSKQSLSTHRPMIRNILVFTASSILSIFMLEFAIRYVIGTYDEDGQFRVLNWTIRPLVLPHKSIKREIEHYVSSNISYLLSDENLGWSIRPNSEDSKGLYRSNSIGIRSDREFEIETDSVRIGLFGDSFVHSDDVVYDESLAHFLEINRWEVMNFGVPGYGNDQAYLRWKYQGREFRPDIVVIGFQPENCLRNHNLIRKFYSRDTIIPFSKPRFIETTEGISVVNFPTIEISKIPAVVKEFHTSPYRQYEEFYSYENYFPENPLYSLRIFGVLEAGLGHRQSRGGFLEPDGLCYSIISQFYRDASQMSDVVIVHLPTDRDLDHMDYGPLLDRLKHDFQVVDPVDHLRVEERETIFVNHYTGKANAIIAENIRGAVEMILKEVTRGPDEGEPSEQ